MTIKEKAEELVKKLLSFKFAIFVITCVLRIIGVVGNVEWLTVTGMVITGHVGMKALHITRNDEECGG
jgi:hypothetical protein